MGGYSVVVMWVMTVLIGMSAAFTALPYGWAHVTATAVTAAISAMGGIAAVYIQRGGAK